MSSVSEEAIEWIRSRPESVKEMMRRFPPSCVVRVLVPRCCGVESGDLMVIHGYNEDGKTLVIRHRDGHGDVAVHRASMDSVEYVSPWEDLTPELVREILK